jgi:hypothetical protein
MNRLRSLPTGLQYRMAPITRPRFNARSSCGEHPRSMPPILARPWLCERTDGTIRRNIVYGRDRPLAQRDEGGARGDRR